MARATLRLASAVVVGILLASAAACTRDEGKVQITPVVNAAALDDGGRIDLDAECPDGSVLVGGGYAFLEPPLSAGNPLIVEASFPLNEATWRITVTRPGSFDDDRDGIPTIFMHALCVSIQGSDLETQVIASTQVLASAGSTFDTATVGTECPAGTVRTSGGFRVTPASDDDWNVAGLYNSWMWESAPDGASGWTANLRRIAGIQGPTPPQLRAYALCSDQAIGDAEVVTASAERRNPSINFGYLDGEASCGEDRIASGGGYAFSGDALVPHHVHQNSDRLSDGSWAVTAVHGFDVGGSGSLEVSAVCLSIPQIVTATILSPRGEHCTNCTTDVEYPVMVGIDAADPTQSETIEFTGSGTDGQGDPLTGAALAWTSYAQPGATGANLGSGESIAAQLPAPPPGSSAAYLIELTATDPDGNTGTDAIWIVVSSP